MSLMFLFTQIHLT